MTSSFTCPHCGLVTAVDPKYAGKSGPCAGCGRPVTIPERLRVQATAPASASAARTQWFKWMLILVPSLTLGGLMLYGAYSVLAPATRLARASIHRSRCQDNLQQIALAIQQYHDEHGHFPPAFTVDEKGAPLHSWRVLILPYLGPEAVSLHELIDLNQPWDSAFNRLYWSTMPSVYGCPADVGAAIGETCYLAITGSAAMFPEGRTRSRQEVEGADGLEQTLLIVEVESAAINWMEPKDLKLQTLTQGINSGVDQTVASNHPGDGAHVVFANGRIAFVSDLISGGELSALATPAGGETVEADSVFLD